MVDCSITTEQPGDDGWNKKRIWRWILAGAFLGAAVGFVLFPPFALVMMLGTALTGAFLAGYIGNAWNWFTDRLKEQNPKTITISGLIECKGKNLAVRFPPKVFDPQLFGDGDLYFNVNAEFRVLMPEGLDAVEIRTRAAPDSGQSQSYGSYQYNDPNQTQVLHTEISSYIGHFSAVGGVIGAIAGAILGSVACAILTAMTLGGLWWTCLILPGLFTWLGGQLGGLIGTGLGALADEFSDFDQLGEMVEDGACMLLTGRWVTDIWHQHNEIHDVESAQIIECNVDPETDGLILFAAVGIGRHPTGRDP